MTSEQRANRTDELISTSEALRAELLREVDKLESFVQELHELVELSSGEVPPS